MNWEWIILLFVLTIVYSVDLPNDLQQTSNQTKPNKRLNKARHKKSRNTDYPLTPVSGPLRNTNEPFFPDVIYPTSILEVSQPFYYSQPGNDVLAPFSNDVKSSYKTLNSEKTKPSNDISLTHQEKNNVSQNITANQENNSNVLYSDEPFSRNMSTSTEQDENTSHVEDIKEKLNGSDEAQNELERLEVLEGYDILHANTSYNDNGEYMQYTNPTSISNVYDITVDPAQDVLGNYTQTKDPINSNRTYHVNTNPNYVMTSDTGNTHEDFVNDILNIYSLIEESIRAISVVEFVVSKTLGTLGLDDKRNETIVSEDLNDNLNVTDDLYHDNDTSLYNSYKSKEMLKEEIQKEQNALKSEINEEIGPIVEQTLKSDINNSNQSGFIWEKPADEYIPKNIFFKRSALF